MLKEHKKERLSTRIFRYLMLVLGAAIAAAAIELFLIPNKIIDGGIIGISLLINHITAINFGILVIIINLPFLYFGYKHIGKKFFISSIIAVVSLAIVQNLLHHIDPITNQAFLATVFGGLLLGAGVGIVIRSAGALDGTEILGIILAKILPFSVGEFIMFFNIFVFGWAGFVIGWEQALFSIVTYFIAYKTIDTVIQGLNETRAFIIVTDHYEELGDTIMSRLGRGVTKFAAKGGHLGVEKEVLYVVVTRLEVTKLKGIIHDIDPKAFITIMNTQEAQGAKFKSAIH